MNERTKLVIVTIGFFITLCLLIAGAYNNEDPSGKTQILVPWNSKTQHTVREMDVPEGRIVFTHKWAVFIPGEK